MLSPGGVRVAAIATPTVVRVARNMFGCRTLLGAELAEREKRQIEESGGGGDGDAEAEAAPAALKLFF
jgi:hypothetical protein